MTISDGRTMPQSISFDVDYIYNWVSDDFTSNPQETLGTLEGCSHSLS